jgi:hypothetical protein
MMYASGKCVSVGKFSREKVGEMVNDYVANAARLSDRRWKRLIEMCGAVNESIEDTYPPPSAPSMKNKRRALYSCSSPMSED